MSRKPTKRWLVDEFTNGASGEKVRVYYDKNDKIFWSKVGPETIEGETQDEVGDKANEAATRLLVREDLWERKIIIVPTSDKRSIRRSIMGHNLKCYDSPSVGFTAACLWMRKCEDGSIFARDWDRIAPDDDSKKNEGRKQRQERYLDVMEIKAAWSRKEGILDDDEVVLPCTDELWERLKELSDRLEQIQDALVLLVHRDDIVEQLLGGVDGLLPAMKKDAD